MPSSVNETLIVKDLELLKISKPQFKSVAKKTHVSRFHDSQLNHSQGLFIVTMKETVSGLKQWICALFNRLKGMEDNRAAAGNDQALEPGPLIGRPVSVFTIDEGPDNTQLWKKLCVVLLGFILFLIFMLVIKSFTC